MVNGWQSLALARQNLSLEAHSRDPNLKLELLSAPFLSPVFATHPRPQWGKRVTSNGCQARRIVLVPVLLPALQSLECRICLSTPFFARKLRSQAGLRFRHSAKTR